MGACLSKPGASEPTTPGEREHDLLLLMPSRKSRLAGRTRATAACSHLAAKLAVCTKQQHAAFAHHPRLSPPKKPRPGPGDGRSSDKKSTDVALWTPEDVGRWLQEQPDSLASTCRAALQVRLSARTSAPLLAASRRALLLAPRTTSCPQRYSGRLAVAASACGPRRCRCTVSAYAALSLDGAHTLAVHGATAPSI